eukprot:1145181-Pelagomonas_calceolata.AAC.4
MPSVHAWTIGGLEVQQTNPNFHDSDKVGGVVHGELQKAACGLASQSWLPGKNKCACASPVKLCLLVPAQFTLYTWVRVTKRNGRIAESTHFGAYLSSLWLIWN